MDKTCANVLLGIILHCLEERDKMTYIWFSQLFSFGFVREDWCWLWGFFYTYSFWYFILNWETLSVPI